MRRLLSLVLVSVAALGAACGSDEAKETVGDARDDIEDTAGSVGERATAEAMRAALKSKSLDANETVRDVKILRDAVDDLPGSPNVTGITDENNDGKDDDDI